MSMSVRRNRRHLKRQSGDTTDAVKPATSRTPQTQQKTSNTEDTTDAEKTTDNTEHEDTIDELVIIIFFRINYNCVTFT